MKIYEIGTGYTPIPAQIGAATEIVVEELTRAFIKNGQDAEIIDIKASNRSKTELPISEVKVPKVFTKTDVSLGVVHKLKRVVYSISLAYKLSNILKNSDEKVILHFHNQYNLFFTLKLLSKKRLKKATIAYTVHSYIWGTDWDKIENIVKKKYFQEVECVKKADLVLVLNNITKEHFVNKLGLSENKIYKVINGVNIDRYSPLADTEISELKINNQLENKKIIFQVGSVCERKNQLETVKMLSDYMRENKDIIYMYAGGIIDSNYQQAIIDFAAEQTISNQVKYVGEVPPGEELNKYYNMADCCVFTSNLESFGLVIIEAISSGTPVVLSENLMFSLTSGYKMYNSKESFVSMVEEAIKNGKIPRDECIKDLEKFSWSSVADKYFELFSSIK